jgi:tetratricopeptide (TPR) repeat protein
MVRIYCILKFWFISLVFLASTPSLFAQVHSNVKEQLLEAESNFVYEEFNEALPIYMKLKDRYPDNAYLDYKIGRCYLNIPFEKQKSISYLQKAEVKMSRTSKDGNFKHNEVPLDVIFYLGDAYRINNQIEKAIDTYQDFKNKLDDKTYNVKIVDDDIQACKRAKILEKDPVEVIKLNMGGVINTRFSESHPVVSEDESIILYSSQLPFYQAVFFTTKVNGTWQQPINIIPDLGIDGDCIPTCLSADGKEAYFYRSDEFKGDIYVSNFINGKWTKIRKLNNNINTKYWESHASLSHDGKTLYFTSNRPGGIGGLDIYKSQRTLGDNWGPAQNLGPVINSSYNEDSPFITADGKRLYFSSFGHETIGGYDIFYSDLDANGNWTKPVNIGFPINSTDDDVFFCPIQNGKVAYISEYDQNGFGKTDIIRIEIPDKNNPQKFNVTGKIRIPGRGNNQKITIVVVNHNRKDTIYNELLTSEDFTFRAKEGDYDINISATGYQSQIIPVTVKRGSKDLDRSLSITLIANPNKDNSATGLAAVNDIPGLQKDGSNANRNQNNTNSKNGTNLSGNDLASNTKDNFNNNIASNDSFKKVNSGVNSDKIDTNGIDSLQNIKSADKTNVANSDESTRGKSKSGFWKSLHDIKWEYFAVPCFLILLIILLLIIKKIRKPEQN